MPQRSASGTSISDVGQGIGVSQLMRSVSPYSYVLSSGAAVLPSLSRQKRARGGESAGVVRQQLLNLFKVDHPFDSKDTIGRFVPARTPGDVRGQRGRTDCRGDPAWRLRKSLLEFNGMRRCPEFVRALSCRPWLADNQAPE